MRWLEKEFPAERTFFDNTILILLTAGVLYPAAGILMSPIFAGAAMAYSSVSVIANSLRLKTFRPRGVAEAKEAEI